MIETAPTDSLTAPGLSLLCPICDRVLESRPGVRRCAAGHAFDMAREGYVNLLVWPGRPPTIQGDTRAMLQARRRFLTQGHYAPLAERLAALAASWRPSARVVVEGGCGEGYFIGRISPHLSSLVAAGGFDLSKEACRLAARHYPGVTFWTGDVYRRWLLPDQSVDVVLNILSPRQPAEMWRVLRPGGLLLVVIPAVEHLVEARARYPMLGMEAHKQAKVVAQMAQFELVSAESLTYPLALETTALRDLLAMTPSAWHLPDPAALDLTPLSATAAFTLLAFRRQPAKEE